MSAIRQQESRAALRETIPVLPTRYTMASARVRRTHVAPGAPPLRQSTRTVSQFVRVANRRAATLESSACESSFDATAPCGGVRAHPPVAAAWPEAYPTR